MKNVKNFQSKIRGNLEMGPYFSNPSHLYFLEKSLSLSLSLVWILLPLADAHSWSWLLSYLLQQSYHHIIYTRSHPLHFFHHFTLSPSPNPSPGVDSLCNGLLINPSSLQVFVCFSQTLHFLLLIVNNLHVFVSGFWLFSPLMKLFIDFKVSIFIKFSSHPLFLQKGVVCFVDVVGRSVWSEMLCICLLFLRLGFLSGWNSFLLPLCLFCLIHWVSISAGSIGVSWMPNCQMFILDYHACVVCTLVSFMCLNCPWCHSDVCWHALYEIFANVFTLLSCLVDLWLLGVCSYIRLSD